MQLYSLKTWKEISKGIDNDSLEKALSAVYEEKTIQKRFDNLCQLFLQCDKYLQNHPDTPQALEVRNLAAQAFQLAAAIVDAGSEKELKAKINLRQLYKNVDPHYMPWHLPITRVDPSKLKQEKVNWRKVAYVVKQSIKEKSNSNRYNKFNQHYKDEGNPNMDTDFKHVVYLNKEQREQYRVIPSQGRLMHLVEKNGSLHFEPFSTFEHSIKDRDPADDKNDRAIFVISARGEIFAGSGMAGQFHHSSFLGREPNLFAGSLSAHNGQIDDINDASGHFTPGMRQNIQALAFLRSAGLLENNPSYNTLSDNENWQGLLEEDRKGYDEEELRGTIQLRTFDFTSLQTKIIKQIDDFIANYTQKNADGKLELDWSQKLYDEKYLHNMMKLTLQFKDSVSRSQNVDDLSTQMKHYFTQADALGKTVWITLYKLKDFKNLMTESIELFQTFKKAVPKPHTPQGRADHQLMDEKRVEPAKVKSPRKP